MCMYNIRSRIIGKVFAILSVSGMLGCSAVINTSCRQTHGNMPQSEEKTDLTRVQREARLNALLCERDFGQALLLIDTLRAQYPRIPQFYFCEGWVYDMKGDSVRARSCYTQAVSIYDSLIAVKKDFGDQVNRAILIQLLYGQKAYDNALNKILRTVDNSHDSVMVEDLYRKCAFKKEDLFRPKSLGTYQASYRCVVAPGDVDSEGEESFVDLFFYDGQLASGHFWGTTRDLGDVQTKGRNGYFVLPLRHIRQEGNDCFFELRLEKNCFFKAPVSHHLSSAQEALAQGCEPYDEPSFTIKDSVIPFRMTVKGDTLFMVNQHSKSQKVPKKYIRECVEMSSES